MNRDELETKLLEMLDIEKQFFICLAQGRLDNDFHEAEDAVQNAVLNAVEAIRAGQYDERKKMMPWFTRIVTNTAMSARRKKKSKKRDGVVVPNDDIQEVLPNRELSPEYGVEIAFLGSYIERELNKIRNEIKRPAIVYFWIWFNTNFKFYLSMPARKRGSLPEWKDDEKNWTLHDRPPTLIQFWEDIEPELGNRVRVNSDVHRFFCDRCYRISKDQWNHWMSRMMLKASDLHEIIIVKDGKGIPCIKSLVCDEY